ncbi:MAG: 23S rRNA (guanosine(2251)-2'-O)-methyltransferase RlmB [Rhodomicrobium sp.]|nr:MAG: 23S rRNA (guanosine(2251)-2'-O)-methyltransferase RlmB [Rhodomicrobium sp.]
MGKHINNKDTGGSENRSRRPNKRHGKYPSKPGANDDQVLIWGIHAVTAALSNPERVVDELLLTDNAAARIEESLGTALPAYASVSPKDLTQRLGVDPVHQGALLRTKTLPALAIEDISDTARLVVLDQVTDPHNVGAILRSAAAFGIDGLIMTQRNSPPQGGVLAKTASGGLEHVPLIMVGNLSQALTALGKKGFERIGFDGAGETVLGDTDPLIERGIALVFGAEEKGLRRLTMENCDQICRIHAAGAFRSLNVSNAAAIAFHHFQKA